MFCFLKTIYLFFLFCYTDFISKYRIKNYISFPKISFYRFPEYQETILQLTSGAYLKKSFCKCASSLHEMIFQTHSAINHGGSYI